MSPTTLSADPSMEEIHAMYEAARTAPIEIEPGSEPETEETEVKPVETGPKGDGKQGQEPDETEDSEEEIKLPRGVEKRLKRIAEDTARNQRLIDEAMSKKKETEAKLAELTGKPG